MKLYLWKNVLRDHTPGVMFAIADSVEEARRIIREKYVLENPIDDEPIELIINEPQVIDGKFAFYMWGGG